LHEWNVETAHFQERVAPKAKANGYHTKKAANESGFSFDLGTDNLDDEFEKF
jgi:hypothetical protein